MVWYEERGRREGRGIKRGKGGEGGEEGKKEFGISGCTEVYNFNLFFYLKNVN